MQYPGVKIQTTDAELDHADSGLNKKEDPQTQAFLRESVIMQKKPPSGSDSRKKKTRHIMSFVEDFRNLTNEENREIDAMIREFCKLYVYHRTLCNNFN